jgi:hypothetical protein
MEDLRQVRGAQAVQDIQIEKVRPVEQASETPHRVGGRDAQPAPAPPEVLVGVSRLGFD